jgi:hypothetical protein
MRNPSRDIRDNNIVHAEIKNNENDSRQSKIKKFIEDEINNLHFAKNNFTLIHKISVYKSFLQLSTERNNAVKTYILEQLNANGFNKWCKGSENIIQNPKGDHDDGTSGPNPPIGTAFILKGQEKMEPPSSDEKKRNQCGEPHPRPEDYDKYKYSIPRVRVGFNEITPPTPGKDPKLPIPNVTTRYVAEFKGNIGLIDPNDIHKRGRGSSTTVHKPIRGEVKTVKMSCPVFRVHNEGGLW